MRMQRKMKSFPGHDGFRVQLTRQGKGSAPTLLRSAIFSVWINFFFLPCGNQQIAPRPPTRGWRKSPRQCKKRTSSVRYLQRWRFDKKKKEKKNRKLIRNEKRQTRSGNGKYCLIYTTLYRHTHQNNKFHHFYLIITVLSAACLVASGSFVRQPGCILGSSAYFETWRLL